MSKLNKLIILGVLHVVALQVVDWSQLEKALHNTTVFIRLYFSIFFNRLRTFVVGILRIRFLFSSRILLILLLILLVVYCYYQYYYSYTMQILNLEIVCEVLNSI